MEPERGGQALCESCNNSTGAWYGPAYVSWAQQGVILLKAYAGGRALGASPFTIYPLRVFKQLLVMFCSACGPGLRERLPGLERYLLNRGATDAPAGIRLYAYYVDPIHSHASRQSGISGVVDVVSGRLHMISEIAFLPFGLILDVGGEPIDNDLADITFLGRGYTYADESDVRMDLPVRPVNSPLPADFRTRELIRKTLSRAGRRRP